MSPDDPLRILFLTTSLMRGGAETQVFLLAEAFRARGHAVHVVSMLPAEAYVEELGAMGADVTSLDIARGAADPRAMTRLAGVVRRWKPDVVHSHMVHANLLARLARPLAWAPVQISTAHNLTEGARWRELGYRATDALATLTTNVCEAGTERYVNVGATPRDKIVTMPNGLEVDAVARPLEVRRALREELGVGDRFAWLAVGRLEEQKDYPTMLRALTRTREEGADDLLLVVGEGSLREAIVRERDALGLGDDAVRFLGSRDDVPDLMAAADGYLMSSAWEGLPMVLLEASSAGLPMVTTDVGGNEEVVLDGTTGFLVPPGDPDALAGAMRRFTDLPEERRHAMGEAALQHARENFTIDRVADRWMDLYREQLARVRTG